MAIESLGAVSNNSLAGAQAAGVSIDDFLKILLTQLQFQDPLKPMDNQEFIAQMAQFTSLEQTRQSNERLDALLTVQAATQSIGLIGKTVEVTTSSGTKVGTATTITFANGVPELTVRTSTGEFLTGVTLSKVRVVRNA
jgi:flagellar basal-body rod modification protein FlgD